MEMRDNNTQNILEPEKKNLILEKLKQVQKKTLYIWIAFSVSFLVFVTTICLLQIKQITQMQKTIETMTEEVEYLTDEYNTTISDNEELQNQLEKYQDQQVTIDELNNKLIDLQEQYNLIKEENDKLKVEKESLNQSNGGGASGFRFVGENDSGEMVWLSETGSKYHSISDCGNMNPNRAREVLRSSAEEQGYSACSKCY